MESVILFYTPPLEIINHYTRIFVELIELNLSNKNKILIVECEGKKGLDKCVANYRGDRAKCYKCKSGLFSLKEKYLQNININFIKYETTLKSFNILKLNDHRDLKKFEYKGINIGLAVHSSTITTFKDHAYSIRKKEKYILNSLKSSAITIETLIKNDADLMFTFNGRASHYNSILNYAKFFKKDFSVFEVSANKEKYVLIENEPIHSADSYTREIENTWNNSRLSIREKEKKGNLFFKINSGIVFSKKFNIQIFSNDNSKYLNSFKRKIKNKKRIISIFNSSRDEFECIENWNNNRFYEDDEQLIDKVCKYFIKNPHYIFVLRVHPNQKYLLNTQNKNIEDLSKNKNLIIIGARSKISSYEIIRLSDTIITFGSTVGVEATFLEKKAITLGDSIYEHLDCTHNPDSMESLIELIKNVKTSPKPKSSTLKYGFYVLNNGNEFKYSKLKNVRYSLLIYWLKKIVNFHKYLTPENYQNTLISILRKF